MIKVTPKGAERDLARLARFESQITFATALALTRTAQTIEGRLKQEMQNVFDRPTRWTLNSLRVSPATKKKLEARVWMKDEADKSIPATKWLTPEITGGPRQDKASERNLRQRGILPSGKYIMPGRSAKLDQYGNLPKGVITKALSGISGFDQRGFNANATGSRRSRAKGNSKRYFVMYRGKTPIGIAERTSRNRMSVLLAFVGRPAYPRRLDFYGIADQVAAQTLRPELVKAIRQALSTAR